MSKFKSKLSVINASELRAEKELKFSVLCKNEGTLYHYDLSKKDHFSNNLKIAQIASWSIFKRRNRIGHISRDTIIQDLKYFFDFLAISEITCPSALSKNTLSYFAEWLKNYPNLKYSTAGSIYRKLAPIFRQMNKHELVDDKFIPTLNAFPKSTQLSSLDTGYSKDELKNILQAATRELRIKKNTLEKPYKRKWLNKPPPLADVAPIGRNGHRSFWASHEYRVWWWENNCNCEQLSTSQLQNIPQGQIFVATLRDDVNYSKNYLREFYLAIGAGENYQPKYLGQDNPIKYRTPWRKNDYLIWYWENHMNCQPLSSKEVKNNFPSFYSAVCEYEIKKVSNFMSMVGVYRWLQCSDLIPYYLMLLIRTGLNPTTIQRLTIDCLVQDPLDKTKKSIDWSKFRSFKKGKTIPIEKDNDNWPVMLIERVIQITAPIREEGQLELWIGNSNVQKKSLPFTRAAFRRELRKFSSNNKLTRDDGSPLFLQAKSIRPTIAWQEYLRTEDLSYLQTMLGHSKLSTTTDYLRKIDDPIFLLKRSIHQEAMFTGLSEDKKIEKINLYENTLNHCKSALDSPLNDQKKGEFCTATHERCLSCQNLVITPQDIKKYFSFLAYYEYVLNIGDISEDEYQKLTTEKRFIWENQILNKYPKAFIDRIQQEAIKNPVKEWDSSSYESKKI